MQQENNSVEVTSKKSWFRKHPFLTGFGVLIIIIIVASASGDSVPKTTSNEASSQSEKSYQQVFTFSGNGAKKSEPFTISGDRFKITYDCKGDPSGTYCAAFVFRVGSTLPQAVMNSPQAVKDETIIYSNLAGKGDYYLDANTMGNFTMTVYDYR